MATLSPPSPPPNFLSPRRPNHRTTPTTTTFSVKPPPPGFDYRSTDIYSNSLKTISKTHPELLDLAEMGCLIRVEKNQYGPVPEWRSDFVEPDEIWLIGTTHVGVESSGHVDRVVRSLVPDNVVVELCRSRAGIMYTPSSNNNQPGQELKSNMFALSGAEFFGAVGRSINLGGQTALALRFLLAVFSSKISSDINRPFGDEFRIARVVSEEIGAQVVLGDRPIEITLERAWNSLNWTEKMSLISSVVRGISSSSDASKDDVKKSKAADNPYELYEKLSLSYPSLLQPLIHERDTYLAWSLKRSKAVQDCKRVVGVIGKGHLNGVIYALISDLGDLRFRDLAGYKSSGNGDPNAWIYKFLNDLARDTLIGVVLWLVYEQLKPYYE